MQLSWWSAAAIIAEVRAAWQVCTLRPNRSAPEDLGCSSAHAIVQLYPASPNPRPSRKSRQLPTQRQLSYQDGESSTSRALRRARNAHEHTAIEWPAHDTPVLHSRLHMTSIAAKQTYNN